MKLQFMKGFSVCLVFCIALTLNAQSYSVKYHEKRIIDPHALIEMDPVMQSEAVKSYEYTLIYSNGESLYKNSGDTKNFDKLPEPENDLQSGANSVRITRKDLEKYYYKNFPEKFMLFEIYNAGKQWYGRDALMEWNWEFVSEDRKIGDYICKKAISSVGGLSFTAWYAPEIPIFAGPEKFDGLPGLILLVETPYFEWLATAIDPNPEKSKIEVPVLTQKTHTLREVFNLVEQARKDFRPSVKTHREGNLEFTTKSQLRKY